MNIFELFGVISIKDSSAMRTLDKVGKAAISCGKTVAKGLAVVGAAGATLATALAKSSIENYAEYEQLVGGIETLFKDSQGKVMEYAKNAYKTAGLSANDYMSTVTSFSASLLQGLGGDTAAAAEMANMAVTDMSDNANKMGTDISMLQTAYQGFAKGQFQLLDNLKLGYGGTQEEMARLINDSGVMGKNFKATAENVKDISFAKMIEAIHVVQTEMGITGTTAKEATETITGSFNSWKATWTNLMTGLADDENIEPLVDAFFDAGQDVLRNIGRVLPKIGKNIVETMKLAGQRIRTTWSQNIWPSIQEFTKAKLGIELPEWSAVETSLSTWWSTTKGRVESFCTWTLKLFEAPNEAAGEAGEAIADWWNNTAKPGILGVSTWALNLFGVPVEDDATIAEHVGTWWKTKHNIVAGACSWALQLFGVPEEKADAITEKVANWWNGAVDLVVGACNWMLSQPEMPSVAEMCLAIKRWWDTEAVPKLPSLVAQVKVQLSYHWGNLKTGLGIAAGSADVTTDGEHTYVNGETNPEIDAISSPTIQELTGGEYGAVEGNKASGFRYVPYDNYRANLHMGEMVLPRNEAEEYRRGGSMDNSGLIHAINALSDRVTAIMQQVAANTAGGQNVVLDTGVLVGQMAPRLDAQLGTLTARKERRG